MSAQMTKKSIKQLADIDVSSVCPVTYFPFMEYTRKIGYSAGVNGWTSSLYEGTESGMLYRVDDYGNDGAPACYELMQTMGAREHYVMDNLARVETMEHKDAHAVLRFVARDNEHSFTVATFDRGHNWTICG